MPPGGQAALAFELRQQPVDRGEPGGAFDLRQNDAVEPGPHDREQIAVAELGIDGVDPDIQQAAPLPREAAATASRAAGFSAVATASSRSRITASASSDRAFSTRRA